MAPFAAALFFCATLHGAEKVSFNRDIRPIFSDTCFQCHGPDEAKRKSGVRFDQRESAVQVAKSGDLPIVPGQPEASEVMNRLTSTDPDELMPPPKLHKKLTPQQIETVRRWIAAPPSWLEIHAAPIEHDADGLAGLDAGEREAITLALAIKADLLLMDDREGVAAARRRGFAVTGTLGLLDLAARRSLVDLAAAFSRLKATSFYYRRGLLDALLAQHGDKTP